MFKLTGYYQLPGQMPQPVDFSDLFDTAFMRRYTRCRSFEKFLAGGRLPVHSQADFEALPEAQMDAHVRRTTKFSSWKEMLDTATDIYARHALLRQASQK
ncbi:MAG: hypothetical protein II145_10160 [Selenomonas sp.]|jgi:hypothetical protein|nr:hypothetical protein [Selenomonas sp.]MCI7330215.1 hypothetical protein [Selenomonadaceae bacterium]MDD6119914.1 hypothetical protein [Selenomonadaceae bacterium]MDD7056883.1 hypothetical protein [Selenomonadaceae bacterium]MDY3915838.1 hypothetical protein [Selenomonadaceae bacterium]